MAENDATLESLYDELVAQTQSLDEVIQSLNKDAVAAERFLGFLEALRVNELARFLAEPTIATLDGRPASLNVAEATKLDVVPIVRGDGRVLLEPAPMPLESEKDTVGNAERRKPAPAIHEADLAGRDRLVSGGN